MFSDRLSPAPLPRTAKPLPCQTAPPQPDSRDPSQPKVALGLTKIEAEDLLDRLEATGNEPCHLSYLDGQGFSVRSESTAS
jgi:hypothetical protein